MNVVGDKMNSDNANFAGDGKIVIPIGGSDDSINDIAVQTNGKIVAVGSSSMNQSATLTSKAGNKS